MPQKYFRIINDSRILDRWYLDEPLTEELGLDIWDFTDGKTVSYQGVIKIAIQYEGPTLDFTFAAFDIPVVSKKVGKLIQMVDGCSIQRFDAVIDDIKKQYEVLIITNTVDCFDEKHSEFIRWKEDDGRPDKINQIRMITELHIDKSKIDKNVHIFRIKGWEVALVVSEKLKEIMESEKVTGIQFLEV
jgi:hypothetical protein